MPKPDKKIIILTEDELRKTFSRLTYEIIEKISNLENLLLVGIPTRGVHLAEVLRKEMLDKTGVDVKKGIIDPTFYRDDQNRVLSNLLQFYTDYSSLFLEVFYSIQKPLPHFEILITLVIHFQK